MRLTWPHGLLLAGVTLAHAAALRGMHPLPAQAPMTQGQPRPAAMILRMSPTAVTAVTAVTAAEQANEPTPVKPTARSSPVAEAAPRQDGYLPAHQLDWPALPRSAPDTALLDGHTLSGLPLRLRLYIDADGRVTAVEALIVADNDRPALPALQAMFGATAYSPGRRQGRDVASTLDLALGVALATAAGAQAGEPSEPETLLR